ncbi:peptidyl-prolyl cis-trans isomerase FKBP13, chloroplastic-like isoform X2 [Magnolia sinica]|uniref:peptidyl-prolyl cis-trans isomerase FKBP13, chloroplastic-like isoform X2 n=1 Tax=Magnolia sinica TaxID=86752 RepID=UPI00265A43D5|nr:peptidyl-prolyl cis-trans isomerase FKBP13, chloroplastic-like isoform X2 [Magnolia sinica]
MSSSNTSAFLLGSYQFPNPSSRSRISTVHPKQWPTGTRTTLSCSLASDDHDDNHNQKKKKMALRGFTRREAMGLAFSLGLLDALRPTQEVAAEEAQCALTVAPSGLAFCDRFVGSGPEATKGQLIKAHYVGKLENGKVFDSSYQRGKPLTFRVGVGEVIKGWDQGILGGDGIPPMLAGGKRTLKLPPELGYGIRGAGCKGVLFPMS